MKNIKSLICLISLISLTTACSIYPMNQEKQVIQPKTNILLLNYSDFGPQVMTYELIGYEWNQWKSEGHKLPDDVEVKVVVYRNKAESAIKKEYPVIRGKSDYRYIEYNQAMQFLEKNIKEIEEYKKEDGGSENTTQVWDGLLSTLKKTKEKITQSLST